MLCSDSKFEKDILSKILITSDAFYSAFNIHKGSLISDLIIAYIQGILEKLMFIKIIW